LGRGPFYPLHLIAGGDDQIDRADKTGSLTISISTLNIILSSENVAVFLVKSDPIVDCRFWSVSRVAKLAPR
jgi:hypothetical protein